jgi:2-dehydropantoate 2-reductase
VAEVTLIGTWRQQLEALARRPLLVQATDGSAQVEVRLRATAGYSGLTPFEFILILVKSYQTRHAARWAGHLLAPDSLAVTLQNGLGNLEILTQRLGARRMIQGVTTQGAAIIRPGVVRDGGAGLTVLGRGHVAPRKATDLARLLDAAGLPTQLRDDVRALVWQKLIVSCAINAPAAVLDVANGELLGNRQGHAWMEAAARETAEVALASGIELGFGPAEAVAQAVQVAKSTASNLSSMVQDLRSGRPTEVDAINGAVVRQAARVGVDVPVNAQLWERVRSLEGSRASSEATTEHALAAPPDSERANACG